MIASTATLSTIDDVFPVYISGDDKEDRDRYRCVAGWILFVSIAGMISQAIMLIIRLLYHLQHLKHQFLTFTIIVSSDTMHRGSGVAKGRPGRVQAYPNACHALPFKINIS